jgi:hypothetical protein
MTNVDHVTKHPQNLRKDSLGYQEARQAPTGDEHLHLDEERKKGR